MSSVYIYNAEWIITVWRYHSWVSPTDGLWREGSVLYAVFYPRRCRLNGCTNLFRGSDVFGRTNMVVTAMIIYGCWWQWSSICLESIITKNAIPLRHANSVFFIYLSGVSMFVHFLNYKVLERDEATAVVFVANCDILSNNRPSWSILLAIKLMEQAEWDSSSGAGRTTNWGIIKRNKWRRVGRGVARKERRRFSTVHLLSLCRPGT